jgi:bifunctional non-homologous end joining protein LigD
VPSKTERLDIAGREVVITNPGKVYFPERGLTKLDLVRYYLAVSEPALRAFGGRPMALKRYPDGVTGPFFFQKRAPEKRPPWIETAAFTFPSGRTADELVVRDAAQLAWVVNLGAIEVHAHPVRAEDLDHPDELRVDLDPVPGVPWETVLEVALTVKAVLGDVGLTGWPKTSGSRGVHVWVRIAPRWTFAEVRRAALALAREVERRVPALATSKWWKEERHGVFVDYNQNARDRTTAAAWSVRPMPDARVSMPLAWDEVPGCDPAAFTLETVPVILAERGDPHAGIDAAAGSLEPLLALSREQEKAGLGDAPWPPHFPKAEGEPRRVMPSKARSDAVAAPASTGPGRADAKRAATAAARAVPKPGRRKPTMPLVTVARAATQDEALEGLRRWERRHPDLARLLQPADVLVDSMRGRFTTWTRIRLNLRHVPERLRPREEPPDPDFDPATR